MQWAQGVSSSSRSKAGPHLPKEGDAGAKSRTNVLVAAGVVAAVVVAWKWIRRKKGKDEMETKTVDRAEETHNSTARDKTIGTKASSKSRKKSTNGQSKKVGAPKSLAAEATPGSSSLPRNKRANNKKNKARKAEKKKIKEQKKEGERKAQEESSKTIKEAKAEHKAIEEMDEVGKTFVTTQKWTMPEKYARQGRKLMEE